MTEYFNPPDYTSLRGWDRALPALAGKSSSCYTRLELIDLVEDPTIPRVLPNSFLHAHSAFPSAAYPSYNESNYIMTSSTHELNPERNQFLSFHSNSSSIYPHTPFDTPMQGGLLMQLNPPAIESHFGLVKPWIMDQQQIIEDPVSRQLSYGQNYSPVIMTRDLSNEGYPAEELEGDLNSPFRLHPIENVDDSQDYFQQPLDNESLVAPTPYPFSPISPTLSFTFSESISSYTETNYTSSDLHPHYEPISRSQSHSPGGKVKRSKMRVPNSPYSSAQAQLISINNLNKLLDTIDTPPSPLSPPLSPKTTIPKMTTRRKSIPKRASSTYSDSDSSSSGIEDLKMTIELNKDEEKSHLCSFEGCNKKFKRSEHTRRHERTHTKEKPFGCNVLGCGRFFS